MIRGMWASREMLHENSDKQLFMKTTLRELIIYCVFLFVIVYMTFGQYSSDFYLLRLVCLVLFETIFCRSRIDKLFEKQAKVTQMRDFWVFVEGDLMSGLYWEKLYNKGRKVTEFRCPSTGLKAQCAEPPCPCPVGPMDRNMMYENRMLGVPRMRQIRVTETSCLGDMNQDFSSAIRKCYSPYGLRDEDEDKAPYIPEHRYCCTNVSNKITKLL